MIAITDEVREYSGSEIPNQLKKLYSRKTKFIYQHMVNACNDENLLKHLTLKITGKKNIREVVLIDNRTGKLIEE